MATIGVDFMIKTVRVDDDKIKLQIVGFNTLRKRFNKMI